MEEQLSDMEAKAIYEMTKLASSANFIMNDFVTTIALTSFKAYLRTLENPAVALESFMNQWENRLIQSKEDELEILLSQQDSLSDIVVSNTIAGTIDLETFKKEVQEARENLTYSLLEDVS